MSDSFLIWCDWLSVLTDVWLVVCVDRSVTGGLCWQECYWWFVLTGVWLVVCVDRSVTDGLCWQECDWWFVLTGVWQVVCVDRSVTGCLCCQECDWWFVLSGVWLVVCVDRSVTGGLKQKEQTKAGHVLLSFFHSIIFMKRLKRWRIFCIIQIGLELFSPL